MDKTKFAEYIGHKVRIVHITIDKYFNTCWQKSGLEPTRMQCAVMRYLRQHEGEDVFQKDLEEAYLLYIYITYICFSATSLIPSHPLLPPLCSQVCSLCLRLHCCPAHRFISTSFLDSIYIP